MAAVMVQRGAALLTCLFLAIGTVTGSKYRGQSEVKRGQAFNVTCTVAINEGVSWTKDGRNLTAELGPFSVDERKINESVEATLTVKNAKMAHAGNYQCSNLHKAEKHSVRIKSDAQLTGVYDTEDIRLIDLAKTTFNLTCNLDAAAAAPNIYVEWLKDDTPVGNTTLKDRFKIIKDATKAYITIKPVNEDDFGSYTCRLQNNPEAAVQFRVVGKPHVRMEPHHKVVEGQKVKITCNVLGKPHPTISWTFDNGTTNTSIVSEPEGPGRITLTKNEAGIEDALLILKDAEPSDHGTYRCFARQDIGNATHVGATILWVKDKYAALWPFIGICAEVVILCAIILVYEKRRSNNTDMEDSDTDNHDQKKS